METQEKLHELDKAITWWQASLENEVLALQREAKEAIIRKLKYERRKLIEEESGASLEGILLNLRDTAIDTFDGLTGQLAETVNELLKEEKSSQPSSLPTISEPNKESVDEV
ncbi:hypothetical protein [Tunicatimonas pelagia]|uniref:hypothetical protein n=1 Tax=Tunicatimonas pelagia TaxID=931531 RepID=UPI002664FF22|nr:hypothetical protein [Tunicatimonas pelagia]WKN41765.1 hypothetical protein P0M28_22260 [Tunicatimonas pelagia]